MVETVLSNNEIRNITEKYRNNIVPLDISSHLPQAPHTIQYIQTDTPELEIYNQIENQSKIYIEIENKRMMAGSLQKKMNEKDEHCMELSSSSTTSTIK